MNIVVLGPGAVGSLWAYKLKLAGHNVSVYSSQNLPTLSLELDELPPLSFENQATNKLSEADVLLVTVKAWQVEAAIKPLIKHIDERCIIVFMHNGMGAVDTVAPVLERNPVVLSTTTHGAYKPSREKVLHTGHGNTLLGGYNSKGNQCEFLAEVFNHALADCQWTENINLALWNKLAINCAINPLTAIEQCRNGDLAKEHYQEKLNQIIDEVCQVMRAEKLPITREQLEETVTQVIKATAENYSSMRQDVFYQRKTEIDFITGYLLASAKRHNISAPTNQALYDTIKTIENSWTQS